jgi:AMP-polyphosphate phosphotransferase
VHPGRNGVRVWPVFESAELGHTIDKASFDAELPKLRQALLAAQYRLLEAKRFPVIVLINGVDGAGKGETVNALNAWMDPRHIRSHAFGAASDEERERPAMWRFWRALAPSGRIGIMFGNWYTAPIVDRALGHSKKAQLAQSLSTIEHFERMLTDEGALLLKFWFHLSKDRQKKRLKELEKDKRTRWRVTDHDWENFERYDAFRDVSAHVLRETSSGAAPWIIVDGSDSRYRSLTVGRALLDAMTARLDAPAGSHERQTPREAPTFPADQQTNVLRALDMTQKVEKKTYERDLEHYQGKLNLLCREPKFQQHSLVAVFEGADAAGKGGAIRRVTVALDARQYAVIPVAAPTEEERVQPYLWRFWRHLPRQGHATLFDRSWYGRVLVERVEGFCAERDWMRAYAEINDFEEQLVEHGVVVAKFWLQISKEEQLRRFEERQSIEFKQHKITEEDWRNREKWDAYERAICDMVDRTSTDIAPWTLVAAEDKDHARLSILKTLCEQIEAAL